MINPIKRIKARLAMKERSRHLAYLDSLFAVKEKNGQLWLTCDGIAVAVFSESADAAFIAESINDARTCARSFFNGDNVIDDEDLQPSIMVVDNR